VVEIDRLSFDTAWSARSYIYEVSESSYSHMVSLEQFTPKPEHPSPRWRRWLRNLSGETSTTTTTVSNGNGANGGSQGDPVLVNELVGYGGLWHITDEAHISTIAVHPTYRGRGWGEILLAAMIRRGLTLDAAYVVLEVRVSNAPAQNLYRKYGFEVSGVKPKYYRNNNEDAYDMRLDFNATMRDTFESRFAALQTRFHFTDLYTMQ
jgi:ribosomal-protein-alanine N-acetyltransferase